MVVAYACTVHKTQSLSLDQAVISFDLEKQRTFNPGQMYVAISRLRSKEGLFFTGQFSRSAFTCCNKVHEEYARLRMSENRLPVLKQFHVVDSSLVLSLLNIRSLRLHSIDIQHDQFLVENDILCLTETQIGFDSSNSEISKIREDLDFFNISFNNDQHKFKSLALCHKEDDIDVEEYGHYSGFSLMTFSKKSFSDRSFCLLLLYRSPKTPMNTFIVELSSVLMTPVQIDFILGDFNINGLDDEASALLKGFLCEYELCLAFPTHIDGGMLDHVYISKHLANNFAVKTMKKFVNMSDHDAVKIKLIPKETESDTETI